MKQKNLLKIAMLFVFTVISNFSFGQTTVSYNFSDGGAVSGLNEVAPGITLDTNIGFGSFKNSGTANPGVYSSQLRLYQNATKGGSIIIYASNGVTITDVVINASSRTGPAGYIVDGGAQTNLSAASGTYTISSINSTSEVEFFQRDASSGNRIYVDNFSVTYTSSDPTVTWDGSDSSDWANGANWDSNAVPIATDNVIIPDVTTTPIIGATTGAVTNDLTITEPDGINITAGGSLIV